MVLSNTALLNIISNIKGWGRDGKLTIDLVGELSQNFCCI